MAEPKSPLLGPGNEAEWERLNEEKRLHQRRSALALTPSERVAAGQEISRQAVAILASTIRAGDVPPRAFWS